MSTPGDGVLLNFAKTVGLLGISAYLGVLGFSVYYAKLHVKDPLQSAYVANYILLLMVTIVLWFLSIPVLSRKITKFDRFNTLQYNAIIYSAWCLSLGTFVITDPIFFLAKNQMDGDNMSKSFFIWMAATAGTLGLAGALGIAAGVSAAGAKK
ncbi:hypothetical protein LPJ73_000029 [Coemansia sp. RSA 2703]|nr:hypothetical protein LPJ73_000029 [Coemansia sp. RSA 2703]KAJ2379515.1 hypothetical protein IW150_000095 [Coemansia sp. RSA 2607]KAJ2398503.1 hypothetical protein GGI05_000029 [Coemansia sp. RSA 2603]